MQSFLRNKYAANSVSLTCNTYVCVSPTKQTKVSHSLFIYAFSNLSLTTYLFQMVVVHHSYFLSHTQWVSCNIQDKPLRPPKEFIRLKIIVIGIYVNC